MEIQKETQLYLGTPITCVATPNLITLYQEIPLNTLTYL